MPEGPVIWKFTLDPWDPWIAMPVGARVIHVREQSGQVRLWAEVEPTSTIIERRFGVGLTGGPVPPGKHIGTAIVNEQDQGGMEVVVHVYDSGDIREAAVAAPDGKETRVIAWWRRRDCRNHGHTFAHRTVDAYYCWATSSTCTRCGFHTWRAWEDTHA